MTTIPKRFIGRLLMEAEHLPVVVGVLPIGCTATAKWLGHKLAWHLANHEGWTPEGAEAAGDALFLSLHVKEAYPYDLALNNLESIVSVCIAKSVEHSIMAERIVGYSNKDNQRQVINADYAELEKRTACLLAAAVEMQKESPLTVDEVKQRLSCNRTKRHAFDKLANTLAGKTVALCSYDLDPQVRKRLTNEVIRIVQQMERDHA